MLPPHNLSPQAVSEQEGISLGTLYKWRKEARTQGTCVPDADASGPEGWSARDKFAAVVETAGMNEHDRAEYCRSRGLYLEQLQQWRADCERATELADGERRQSGAEARAERKRTKALEKALKRKEAALAETAALLTLRKKAQAMICFDLSKVDWAQCFKRSFRAFEVAKRVGAGHGRAGCDGGSC